MILFIFIAIGIALYTIFADDWLIDSIKDIEETNKEVKENIEYGRTNYNTLLRREYNKHDYKSVPKYIFQWFILNIVVNGLNCLIVFAISIVAVSFCPKAESYYTFNINSLKDNLVTSGEIHDGAFCVRGAIDGEISYFFSRTTDKGETIGHIPADKSYIKYDDNKKPCVEVHQKNHKIPEIVEKLLFTKWCNEKSVDYYIIIVPNGTILTTETYEIDME
jgi:hypothetical protein